MWANYGVVCLFMLFGQAYMLSYSEGSNNIWL